MSIKYIIEGRKEFAAKFGKERLDQYLSIKDKIPADKAKYKDMDYITKNASPEQLDKFLDYFMNQYQSASQKRKEMKRIADQGTQLMGEENGWKVYWIKTFESSNYHGRGTKWCISGDKPYKDGTLPSDHFQQYKMYGNLYFYIKGNKKIAVFIYDSAKPGQHEIYDETDTFLCQNDLPTDFPDMSSVIPNAPKGYMPTGPECALESFATFKQRQGLYAMQLSWFKSGEIKPTQCFFECVQEMIDMDYHIELVSNSYIYITNRDCGGDYLSYEEFLDVTKFNKDFARRRFSNYDEYESDTSEENEEPYVQKQKDPISIFYSKKDDAYIFPLDRGVEINMDQMDKIEELMDQGYEFCDASEQGMGYIFTNNQQILNRFDIITYTEFLKELG